MTKEIVQLLQQYCFIYCLSALEAVKGEKKPAKISFLVCLHSFIIVLSLAATQNYAFSKTFFVLFLE